MGLHRLTSITIGVPNVEETSRYYADFGLRPTGDNAFATVDGGQQLKLVHTPSRRLVEIGIGVDDPDDLDRVSASLARLELASERTGNSLVTEEPIGGVRAVVGIAPRLEQPRIEPTPYNGPGRTDRPGTRAPGVLREEAVRPRKPGHVVIGSTDRRPRSGSSPTGSASRSATSSPAWPPSCAVPRITTTCSCCRHR